MDRKEALKILELSEGASQDEIKKSRDRLAKKWHPDKNNNSKESTEKFQKIQGAYEILSRSKENGDSSNIDEDAIWKMKQKIKNALDYNNVKEEEMEDDTIRHYESKLRQCKTKEDLEKFTSEVITFIQIYARARDAGYFNKEGSSKPEKPKPSTETRSDTYSSTNSYAEFTCDWCTLNVKSDDPRPKYTFEGIDKAFCCKECRENWDKSDRWWKDWDEKKKKEEQEWEEYKRKQDQKWTDYFQNLNSNSYSSYSSYTYTPSSSGSSSNVSSWLEEYEKEREKQKNESFSENIKRYIRDVEHELSLKSVSEEKLNKKLGSSNWRERISQCADTYEAMDRKFDLIRIVDELSREYTCANCGAVKNNYYPWEKNGKKYCSLDCKDKVGDIDQNEAKKIKKELQEIKSYLKKNNNDAMKVLNDLLAWMKKGGYINITISNGKMVVELSNKQTKTIEESDLTPEQRSVKNFLQSSSDKKTISRSEIEKMVGGNYNDEKGNKDKNSKAGIITAIVVVGLVLAVVVGLVLRNNKKRDY